MFCGIKTLCEKPSVRVCWDCLYVFVGVAWLVMSMVTHGDNDDDDGGVDGGPREDEADDEEG